MTSRCTYRFDPEERGATESGDAVIEAEWRCPHDAHPEADRCVFHLSNDARDDLGVDGDAVTERLREVAGERGETAKQLIGARFDDLSIRHDILDAADKHPLDLRGATVAGTLDLTESEFEQRIDLAGATIGAIDWSESAFDAPIDLSEAVVRGEATLTAAVFEDDVDFTGATFEGPVDVREARFNGDTSLRGARFRDVATFDGVEFRGDANLLDDDVCFEDARFEAPVTFTKAAFRYADFVGCEFARDAAFDRATFGGDAEFVDAAFEGAATFASATFDRDTAFDRAKFDGSVDFAEARFDGDTAFSKAHFEAPATFAGAEFRGRDNLEDDDLSFADATFEEGATFRRAVVGVAEFERLTAAGDLVFDEGRFLEEASFEDATLASLSCDEARFRSDATFEAVTIERDATFRGAEFAGGDNVDDDDISFADATFGGEVDFLCARFGYSDFTGVSFGGDAVFDECRFDDDLSLTDAAFGGAASFDECRFNDDAAFDGVSFEGPTSFRGAEFDGGDNVRDDDVTFSDAAFSGDADFYRAEFEYANFGTAAFDRTANFEAAHFAGEGEFRDATFRGETTFAEARFDDDASFEDAAFRDAVSFLGVEFVGDYHEDDDAAFSGAAFEDEADFREVEFGQTGFDDARFRGPVSFRESLFGRARFEDVVCEGSVDLSFTRFAEPASFDGIAFESGVTADEARFESDASFVESTFEEGATFRGVEFQGGAHTVTDANFEAATFADSADFKLAEFRVADFSGATFEGTALFERAVFKGDGNFRNGRFGASAIFSRSRFLKESDFSSCRFEGEAHFDELRFAKDSTFADAEFGGDATFRSAEFEGSANMHNDDASFEAATFREAANFDKASFLYANFSRTTFRRDATFTSAKFERSVTVRPRPEETETLVDLSDAAIHGGTLGQPEDGDVFYDCTHAEIREVTLDDAHCTHGLFNHFRFRNTDFHGFDFTAHKTYLARNNWEIHTFAASEAADRSGTHTEFTPATLENTYLKAKNCASNFGDRKAAAEFFIKEMVYRRQKNWRAAFTRESDVSVANRTKALGKWVGNKVLHQTCGYGERLWRVVYVSAVAVFIWGVLYTTTTEGTTGSSGLTTQGIGGLPNLFTPEGAVVLGKNMYFSMVTFTTLGYGDIQPVGSTARALAGLEAFLGALLVALVVFVLGRRVAW